MNYKEVPELIGEPLGWDMFKVLGSDGKDTLIERAFLLSAGHREIGSFTLASQSLLCVFTSQKLGKSVAYLEIDDLPGRILSEKVAIHMTSTQYIREDAWQGIHFLESLEHFCSIPIAEMREFILSL